MATSLTKPRTVGEDSPQLGCGRGHGGGPNYPGGPDEFIPNCLLSTLSGTITQIAGTSQVILGVNDFALECWLMGFGACTDVGYATFSLDEIGLGTCEINISYDDGSGNGPTVAGVFWDDQPGTPANINTVEVAMPAGWHHYAINFDRSNLMTLYIDGVSSATADISASVAIDKGNALFDVGSGSVARPLAIGPCAAHVGTLLSTNQLADSLRRKRVQQLAQTVGRYDFRHIRGPTGWDCRRTVFDATAGSDLLHIQGLTGTQVIPIPYGTPEGTNGTVTIPDLSGSGRHLGFGLTTRTSYSTAAPPFNAFGSDPFWEKT